MRRWAVLLVLVLAGCGSAPSVVESGQASPGFTGTTATTAAPPTTVATATVATATTVTTVASGVTTTGLTNLLEGEPWRYVGEAGEPAFTNSWHNVTSEPAMAFRIREAGVVDIQGTVADGTGNSSIFTLPEGYRPSASLTISVTGSIAGVMSAGTVFIYADGFVIPTRNGTAHDLVYINGQFFLDVPTLAP